MSAAEIFEVTNRREQSLSRLLAAFISSGVAFMLLPGTFLGVWNLISISSRHASEGISAAWIQAHGHAQVFGWIGSFVLGIGFYSIPKLRHLDLFRLVPSWMSWAAWTTGVALRWIANVYAVSWRVLLPLSAALELIALAIFLYAVSGHRAEGKEETDQRWVMIVMAGTIGFVSALGMNLFQCMRVALHGFSPAFPADFDQKLLAVMAWGFMVPFVWGFSTKWLPVFLGLRTPRIRLILTGTALNLIGVVLAIAGQIRTAAAIWTVAAVVVVLGLKIFVAPARAAKTKGIHSSFPVFVRIAYAWLLIAGGLALWASWVSDATGIWGASRHALTVGFIAMMVFCVGQRVLPAFAGMKLLWSPLLMLVATTFLAVGCFLRVLCEVLAYQGYAVWAWRGLPISAITELTAVTAFAVNILGTFVRQSPSPPSLNVRP